MILNLIIPIGIVVGCIVVAFAITLTDEDNYKDNDNCGLLN
jgi:hypothetical protein